MKDLNGYKKAVKEVRELYSLGMDLGTSTIKLVVLRDGELEQTWMDVHHGRVAECLKRGLKDLCLDKEQIFSVCLTGSNAEVLTTQLPQLARMGDIPAAAEGVRRLVSGAGAVIEIGSQSSRFITQLQQTVPQFAVNEHCAGGTGSFFEDQMSRLGCRLEDYSQLVQKAESIPRLSGRCAVFAKTDIIHRQQEGSSIPDILLGLCYAMIRNYKATIVRNLPVCKPVVFCGGVTQNAGVIRAVREIFQLEEEELIIPEHACYEAALGAAAHAQGDYTVETLLSSLSGAQKACRESTYLPPLRLREGTNLAEPKKTEIIPEQGCALGIDIGSTSTDLVLIGSDGTLVDFQYLRTAGDPEGAVRKGLSQIRDKYGKITFTAVGVTGSGRERIGKRIGADAVRDEITAQAKGAAYWVPEVDTVFEIGGQDSKYISLKNGEVVDFQMNKICAAGTGSFVEEQAARMGIPLGDFGPLALTAEHPASLGERCTVFIETAIASAAAEGVSQAGIAAGLCHSIVQNYLHKVVGSKPVGQHIVLQGGVDYNPGIVAAFQSAYGDRVQVSPCFAISGAFGAALLAQEAVGDGNSAFTGFDGPVHQEDARKTEEIQRNIEFYRQADRLLLNGYTGKRDPGKKTVGIPFVLMIHKFFPMANAFFSSLGYNVLLTEPTSEDTIRLSQQLAQGETCYPVKLIYGHMQQLIDQKVDYIFLPTIHTMKHEKSHVKHNYGCVYMQTAAVSVARAMQIENYGIQLLSPVFDLDFGQEAMAGAMVGLGKILGIPKPLCAKALLSGAMAVRRHTAAVEKKGKELLSSLSPSDKVLVLITRNYGVSDPVLNMGIPELLLERGYKVITLSHLPAHSLDISEEYENLFYPFGQHIISGAKIIASHPNLYAVYLTNHGCGPDTMLAHLFRQEMGDKPYLQIEVDEHFSNVGVITRIEAFLNSLRQRSAAEASTDLNAERIEIRPCHIKTVPSVELPLYLPAMGAYSQTIAGYYRQHGMDVRLLPSPDERVWVLGRAHTSAKEYLPFPMLLGSILAQSEDMCAGENGNGFGENSSRKVQFLLPQTQGAEADGLYSRVIYSELSPAVRERTELISPVLETLPSRMQDPDAFLRSVVMGDLVYAAPWQERKTLVNQWNAVLSWDELHDLAGEIGAGAGKAADAVKGRLGAVGTPLCLTELDSGVLTTLEQEGWEILRAPLSEALWALWMDNPDDNKGQGEWLEKVRQHLQRIGSELGERSAFAADAANLMKTAQQALPHFAGGNGRYRFAKSVELSGRMQGILMLAPRYENTAMILDMRGVKEVCEAPVFEMSMDNDWDEAAWGRLRSFLYYI